MLTEKYQEIWDELVEEQNFYVSAKPDSFNPFDVLCKFLERVIPDTVKETAENLGYNPELHTFEIITKHCLKTVIQTEKP
jgi:hypothetical protein